MTAPTTRAPAHLHWSDCASYSKQTAPFPACDCGINADLEADWKRGYAAGYEAGATCSAARTPELPTCTESQTGVVDLESRAISHLTDDQAMASFIRWRAGHTDTITLPSLHDTPSISAYVDAIFAQVPHD